MFSGTGLLIGAKLFGILSVLYSTLANGEVVTFGALLNSGIVFYGGLTGFIDAFLLICKAWDKIIRYGVVDIAAVCVPLFHFWARPGCFFAGCCYGIVTHSAFPVLDTNRIGNAIVTASRLPIQLVEAVGNAPLFTVLLYLLQKEKLRGRLLIVYLSGYYYRFGAPGVSIDTEKSQEWLIQSARNCYRFAQYQLGNYINK